LWPPRDFSFLPGNARGRRLKSASASATRATFASASTRRNDLDTLPSSIWGWAFQFRDRMGFWAAPWEFPFLTIELHRTRRSTCWRSQPLSQGNNIPLGPPGLSRQKHLNAALQLLRTGPGRCIAPEDLLSEKRCFNRHLCSCLLRLAGFGTTSATSGALCLKCRASEYLLSHGKDDHVISISFASCQHDKRQCLEAAYRREI